MGGADHDHQKFNRSTQPHPHHRGPHGHVDKVSEHQGLEGEHASGPATKTGECRPSCSHCEHKGAKCTTGGECSCLQCGKHRAECVCGDECDCQLADVRGGDNRACSCVSTNPACPCRICHAASGSSNR
eukprot:jgi/Chlat1/1321/Chrsp118S01748